MRIQYYKRIFKAYLFQKQTGNLNFWHTELKVNPAEQIGTLQNYYLDYTAKTDYPGPFDGNAVPMLNYFGDIGIQYNPDSIAQYALGYFEKYLNSGLEKYRQIFLKQADWYVNNIKERNKGIGVWEYDFDFEYFKTIKGPWYTSLAQAHGISVLVRAYNLTQKSIYLDTAKKAFLSFKYTTDINGGVLYIDPHNDVWLEEAIVEPHTHILNGFIWTLWGVYDYWLATKEENAMRLFNQGIKTLEKNIHRYDNGFWSKYDLAPTKLPGITSHYYHRLHIAQLQVLYMLTDKEIFKKYSEKWQKYLENPVYRKLAFAQKALFKLFYY